MKRILLILTGMLPLYCFAQTNTFPGSGNVGVGTTDPSHKLTVFMDASTNGDGIAVQAVTSSGPGSQPGLAYLNSFGNKRVYSFLDVHTDTYNIGNSLGNALVTINQSGNVGIGVFNPTSALDIGGLIQISGINSGTPPSGLSYGLFPYGGVGLGIFSGAAGVNQGIGFWTNLDNIKKEVVRITSGGNVGIGTNYPTEKLAVNGKIKAKEIKVEAANWPDYVFAKSYQLATLEETEKHIKEKGHLQGMPSAKQVEANGIDLGEMNAKLLKKIEELTLYLIEQNKTIQTQNIRISKQENEMMKYKELINFVKSNHK